MSSELFEEPFLYGIKAYTEANNYIWYWSKI